MFICEINITVVFICQKLRLVGPVTQKLSCFCFIILNTFKIASSVLFATHILLYGTSKVLQLT